MFLNLLKSDNRPHDYGKLKAVKAAKLDDAEGKV
jgi:hypothetical protein